MKRQRKKKDELPVAVRKSKQERKVGRPDRKKKLEARLVNDETVVKCTLGKLLMCDASDKADFIDAIERRVFACSRRTHYASIALNLLVRKLVHQSESLEQLEIPDLTNSTFLRQLMLGTENAKVDHPSIATFFEEHPELLCDDPRHVDDSNIYATAANKMATNLKTHLRTNLDRFMKKYLYRTISKSEALNVLIDIWGWKTAKSEDPKIRQEVVTEKIKEIRSILKLDGETTIDKAWLKSVESLNQILKFIIFVNIQFEKEKKPLINILPINKIKMHYITIDSLTLFGILKELKYISGSKNPLGHDIWLGIFDFEKIIGKNKKFTFTVDTDGVAMTVHFWRLNDEKKKNRELIMKGRKEGNEEEVKKRLKKTTKKEEKPNLENKRIIGLDPGRSNIMTCVEIDKDGKQRKNVLTRRQYYNDSGLYKARTRTNKWNNDISIELTMLSQNSGKYVSLEKFMAYIEVKKTIDDKLWDEYRKRKWREQRFRLYGGKKRTFSRFFNKLGNPSDIIIAYGSAKFAPGGKGEISVPTSRTFKECSYRFKTFVVDEFRSSKIYWKDDSVLQLIQRKDTGTTLRGLLWCNSTNQHICKFVDRDVNGAMNILRCFVSTKRPTILSRSKENSRIEQKVGKVISC
jgi:hypothetical protein